MLTLDHESLSCYCPQVHIRVLFKLLSCLLALYTVSISPIQGTQGFMTKLFSSVITEIKQSRLILVNRYKV